MARSVGEAAATGLESGFRLGMDIQQQRRNNTRQDRLDQQSAEGLAYTQDRQQSQDALRALDEQRADLLKEGTAQQNSPTPPTPEQQDSFTQRLSGLEAARSQHLQKLSGYDIGGVQKQAKVDLQHIIESGDDVSALRPGALTRATTVLTGRPTTDFIRSEGAPAPIEVAGKQLIDGIQNGDSGNMLAGVNAMYAPQLTSGIGAPGAQGGTIVAKRIVNLVPDPKSSRDDPRYIPLLRVYVNNGKQVMGPPADPNAPPNATGHYDAPMTVGRSTDPNDPVKSIGMKEAMDFVGNNLHVAELLNRPDALAKLQEDQQSGDFNQQSQQDYFAALQRLGISTTPKNTIKETVIPAGASVKRTVTDRAGNVVSESTTQGNEKTPASVQLMQARLDEIEADDTLTPSQKASERRAVMSGIKPGKYTGDAPAGGLGSGAGTSKATDTADDKLRGRKLQSIKEDRLSLSNDKKDALEIYKANMHDAGTKAERAAAQSKYDSTIASLNDRDKKLKDRQDKLADEIDNAVAGSARGKGPAPLSAAKPDALPTNKNSLKTGKVYQTSRGPAKWNGTAFEPVQ